jgi:hypothetical protein
VEQRKAGAIAHSWLLHDSSAVTDDLIDMFLAAGHEPDADAHTRIRRIFTRKLLATFYVTPVREVEPRWSFGRWLEAARGTVGVTMDDVAVTVGADVAIIERLEGSNVPPWEFKPGLIADLACLFRIHLTALHQMFLKSAAVARGHGSVVATARSVTRDLDIRAASARRALDLYLAANSTNQAQVPSGALEAIRAELETRNAADLLRT